MLFFNTLEWHRDLKSKLDVYRGALKTRHVIIELSQNRSWADFLPEGRRLCFNFCMNEEDAVFSVSSNSRLFDYRQNLDAHHKGLIESAEGQSFLALLEAVNILWQETQAPISELVKAGKDQLEKVNGEASYGNFSANAKKMPELFQATKLLVDKYLNFEVIITLLDREIQAKGKPSLDLLEKAKSELREFAARGKAIGFWQGVSEKETSVLEGLNTEKYALSH
jgi:hypothetical protein